MLLYTPCDLNLVWNLSLHRNYQSYLIIKSMNKPSVRLIFDRKNQATKSKSAPVVIEVLHQRKRKYLGTGVKLYSDQWNNGKVKNHPQAIQLNKTISDMMSSLYEFIGQTSLDDSFTFAKLDMYWNKTAETSADDSFLQYMTKRIGERPVSDSTKERQRCVLRALHEFGKIRTYEDITLQNIRLFDEYVKTKCTKRSSIYNYHKILKTFVRDAFFAELINFNPYENFKLDKGEFTDRKFLGPEELAKLETKEIENESLSRVRDAFLFCCYTGLAYSDLALFDFEKAVLSNGKYRIRDYRKKTGSGFNITLMGKPMHILEKYNMHLPVISNQKYNSYLKVLGAYCDIKTKLTSHVARHTFATTVALCNGISIEVISKILGHTNIKTTQIYASAPRMVA